MRVMSSRQSPICDYDELSIVSADFQLFYSSEKDSGFIPGFQTKTLLCRTIMPLKVKNQNEYSQHSSHTLKPSMILLIVEKMCILKFLIEIIFKVNGVLNPWKISCFQTLVLLFVNGYADDVLSKSKAP